jgi:hypothetical protein
VRAAALRVGAAVVLLGGAVVAAPVQAAQDGGFGSYGSYGSSAAWGGAADRSASGAPAASMIEFPMDTVPVGDRFRFTAPALEPGHWAVDALRRAEALGLVRDHLPAQRAVPLEVVERALREAVDAASERRPQLAPLAAEWHRRLVAEFPGVGGGYGRQPAAGLLGVRAGAGVETRRGAAGPGLGEFEPHRSGALPLDDRTTLVGGAELVAVLGEHLGARVAPAVGADGVRLEAVELTAGLGGWTASVGRIPIGYAHGVGGGVTLTGHSALDAFGIQTRTPFRLPWVLGHLGPISFTTHFAHLTEERHPGDPYFWSASGQFRPHRRVTLGIHRAAMFGGDHPVEQPVTFGKVVDMLIGRVAGVGFEDQIVSVSGRLHLPTEAVLPLTAYLEWGAEDAAGAWWAVPGRVIGLESPSLPSRRVFVRGWSTRTSSRRAATIRSGTGTGRSTGRGRRVIGRSATPWAGTAKKRWFTPRRSCSVPRCGSTGGGICAAVEPRTCTPRGGRGGAPARRRGWSGASPPEPSCASPPTARTAAGGRRQT